jgi:hypothetical protein
MAKAQNADAGRHPDLDTVVVGCGFSGLYMLRLAGAAAAIHLGTQHAVAAIRRSLKSADRGKVIVRLAANEKREACNPAMPCSSSTCRTISALEARSSSRTAMPWSRF